MTITQFTDIQLDVVGKLDTKYRVVSKYFDAHFGKMSPKQKARFAGWFDNVLATYSTFLHKEITNDDFLLFRVNEMLHMEPEEIAGPKR